MDPHISAEDGQKQAGMKERLYQWARKKAEHPHAVWWLAIIAFTEASFFVVPPDVLLVAILLAGSARWIYLAGVSTVFSVLGGLFGYLIGYALFESVGVRLIDLYNLHDEMQAVGQQFRDHTFFAVFVSAFTPIPYKVFTIAAGLFRVDLLLFVSASLLGRGLRFFAVSYLSKVFGKHVVERADQYFTIVTVLGILLIVLLFLL